jgi:hypothetical protein
MVQHLYASLQIGKFGFWTSRAGQSHARQLDASPVFLYNYRVSVFGYSSTTASIRSSKISLRLIIRGKRSGTFLLERGGNERERAAHGELVLRVSSQELYMGPSRLI